MRCRKTHCADIRRYASPGENALRQSPALPLHLVEVRGESGELRGPGQVGRLFARGPSMMHSYFGQPEATAAVLNIANSLGRFILVEIRCDSRNVPSAAIPRRLGFSPLAAADDGTLIFVLGRSGLSEAAM